MIPPVVHNQCTSPGERFLFSRIAGDPATKDWIVLHSLDIANHVRQVSGEADFVIIIPHKGILCLEVKGCRTVQRRHGRWYYGNDTVGDPRGPFRQASDAMHSIRHRISSARPDLKGVLFWSAVVFPLLVFEARNGPEWHPWQVVDSSDLRSKPVSSVLSGILDRADAHLRRSRTASWYRPELAEPTPKQCEQILQLLRPDFEYHEKTTRRLDRIQHEIKHYSEEQFAALDAMELNPRVIFDGPAGSGKTTLALEAARRSAAMGRKTLLLCFNRLLSRWLSEETREMPLVTTRTLHRHMLTIAELESVNSEPHFWEHELPELAISRVLDDIDGPYLFDELIVDEAQDILKPDYLDFLDLILHKGLGSGRWRFFGDFTNQGIYADSGISLSDFVATRAPDAPIYTLVSNCRNTPRIAHLAELVSDMNPGYRRVLRPDDQVNPIVRYYDEEAEQREHLVNALEEAYRLGYPPSSILILSTQSDIACAARHISHQSWRDRIRPFEEAGPRHVRYCSIHAFKGLEAPYIIVTDINSVASPTARDLLYVAITRTIDRLVLLIRRSSAKSIMDLLVRGRLHI